MFSKMKIRTSTKDFYREMPNGYEESIRKGMSAVRYFSRNLSYGKGTREEQIARLEARVSEIDTEMSDPAIGTQVAKLQELSKEQAACQKQLEKLYEQWEELAE